MVDYSSKKVSELRSDCKKRGIKLPPGYIVRANLVNVLREDDIETKKAEKSVPDPLPQKKRSIYPKLKDPHEGHNTLVIGNKYGKEFSNALYTASSRPEDDTLCWTDLTVKKNVPTHIFANIIIKYPRSLVINGSVDPRRLSSILATLKD